MPVTLQVIYHKNDGATFDMDYYTGTHLPLAGAHFGQYVTGLTASSGLNGGAPDAPSPNHVIATLTFESMDKLGAAMEGAGHVLEDIPNFYSAAPQIMVGEVLG